MEFKNSGFLFYDSTTQFTLLKKDDETTLLQVNSSNKNNKLLCKIVRGNESWLHVI